MKVYIVTCENDLGLNFDGDKGVYSSLEKAKGVVMAAFTGSEMGEHYEFDEYWDDFCWVDCVEVEQ